MDYTGLLAKKYRVNRKLTDEERSNQLHRKAGLDVSPSCNVSVVRINSTYLECVDRWFVYRGSMSAICLLGIGFGFVILFAWMFLSSSSQPHVIPTKFDLNWMLFSIPFVTPFWALMIWMMFNDSFGWTHFPIRFNYRNRMVYVFRPNGTILKAKWDKIFFTLGRCQWISGRQNWDIRGHVLDRDGETVRETFALPGDSSHIDELKSFWEFIRRYMEVGPSSIYREVHWCHDIVDKREQYTAGFKYLVFPAGFYVILKVLLIVLFPMFFVKSLGRWFAMRTSKIPVWPTDVEAQCAVDAFDPYRRDASHNPEKIPLESISHG